MSGQEKKKGRSIARGIALGHSYQDQRKKFLVLRAGDTFVVSLRLARAGPSTGSRQACQTLQRVPNRTFDHTSTRHKSSATLRERGSFPIPTVVQMHLDAITKGYVM